MSFYRMRGGGTAFGWRSSGSANSTLFGALLLLGVMLVLGLTSTSEQGVISDVQRVRESHCTRDRSCGTQTIFTLSDGRRYQCGLCFNVEALNGKPVRFYANSWLNQFTLNLFGASSVPRYTGTAFFVRTD